MAEATQTIITTEELQARSAKAAYTQIAIWSLVIAVAFVVVIIVILVTLPPKRPSVFGKPLSLLGHGNNKENDRWNRQGPAHHLNSDVSISHHPSTIDGIPFCEKTRKPCVKAADPCDCSGCANFAKVSCLSKDKCGVVVSPPRVPHCTDRACHIKDIVEELNSCENVADIVKKTQPSRLDTPVKRFDIVAPVHSTRSISERSSSVILPPSELPVPNRSVSHSGPSSMLGNPRLAKKILRPMGDSEVLTSIK